MTEAEKERARVVEWLREFARDTSADGHSILGLMREPEKQVRMILWNVQSKAFWDAADAIERGEHLKDETQ